jgi:hypothetical protein
MDNLFLHSFVQHAVLSLVPGAAGALLGVALARFILKRTSGSERGPRFGVAYWVPWRGVLVALFVFLLPNAFLVPWLGLGSLAAGLNIFIATLLLALTMLIHLSGFSEGNQTPRIRSLSVFRTALTAAVGLGVVGNFYGAGGAGVLIKHGIQALEYQQLWLGYAIVVTLAILADLVVALLGWRWIIKPSIENRSS